MSEDVPANTNQALAIIRGTSDIFDAAFLKLQLDSFVANAVRSKARGGAMNNVSLGDLLELIVFVPPYEEQKRIVAKVDQLMVLCDQLETQQKQKVHTRVALNNAALDKLLSAQNPDEFNHHWQRIANNFHHLYDNVENIAKLRTTILDLAMRGKLVEQEENDTLPFSTNDEMHSERDKLKKYGILKEPKELPYIPLDDPPFSVPKSWEWYRFYEAVFFQEGPGIRNWQFRDSGIKLLNVQNLVNGNLVLENSDKHVSKEEFEQKYSHFQIEEGDLLWASSGNSWGKTAFFTDPGYPVMMNTSTVRMRFYCKKWNDAFLRYFLDSELFKNQIQEQLQGIQPNFGPTHLRKVVIPVPPIEEQKRIVTKIDQLMTLCNQLVTLCNQLETNIREKNETAACYANAIVQQIAAA